MSSPDGSAQTVISWEQELLGVPNLENRTVQYMGTPCTIVGLLGRDVLRSCRMTYDGPNGSLVVEFDERALNVTPAR